MNYLWVVPYAGRNPPAGMTPSKGAHNTCRFERAGELPPRGGHHRCSSLPYSLWVVPYAERNPPMLVGRALCQAEPSMTCVGRGPVAKPPVMGPAADTWRGSQTALSKPPTGGWHELIVGGALCRGEPSNIWLLATLEGAASEEAAPQTVACSMHRPGHGARREQPRCPWLAARGTGAPQEGGWVGKVWQTELPPPPPPRCTSPPCVDAGYCPNTGPP